MRHRTRHLLLALSIALAGLFVSVNASAYVFINESRCPNGASWSSSNQPQSYWLNQNGSDDIPFSTLESVIQASWDAWSAPCCSSFSASYQGTTSQTATSTNGDTVLSWEENSWPTQLGNVNQTIGVTLISIYSNCEIAQAPILFNGEGFTFTTGGGGTDTDMQSIATHEIGHNLGLGHTPDRSATMYAAYGGGTATRSIEQDDVDGVCALYTTSCNCTSDGDCAANEVCNGGTCEIPPCTSDNECPGNEVCNSGSCEVPPCSSDSDCDDGFYCDTANSTCRPDCPVCEACTQSSDCGSNGFCVDFGNGNNKCIVTCGQGGTCPGDSQCYSVEQQGQTYYLCLNPNANNDGACPDSYTCSADSGNGGGSDGTCDGLGNTCESSQNNNCTTDNDICLQTTDGNSFCSCTCTQDSDCGSGNQCVALNNGSMGCIPGDTNNDPCADVSCPSGQVCQDGQCVNDSTGSDDTGTGGDDTGNTGNEDAGGGGDDTGGTNNGDDAGGGETLDGGMRLPDAGSSNEERNDTGSQSAICSAVATSDSVPAGLLAVLIGFGVMVLRRRRK